MSGFLFGFNDQRSKGEVCPKQFYNDKKMENHFLKYYRRSNNLLSTARSVQFHSLFR